MRGFTRSEDGLSTSDLEMIDKPAHTIKNLYKIEMYESCDGYSEHYPYYDNGISYASTRNEDERDVYYSILGKALSKK